MERDETEDPGIVPELGQLKLDRVIDLYTIFLMERKKGNIGIEISFIDWSRQQESLDRQAQVDDTPNNNPN